MIEPPLTPDPRVRRWLQRHPHPTSFILHMIGIPPTFLGALFVPIYLCLLSWTLFLLALGLFLGGYLSSSPAISWRGRTRARSSTSAQDGAGLRGVPATAARAAPATVRGPGAFGMKAGLTALSLVLAMRVPLSWQTTTEPSSVEWRQAIRPGRTDISPTVPARVSPPVCPERPPGPNGSAWPGPNRAARGPGPTGRRMSGWAAGGQAGGPGGLDRWGKVRRSRNKLRAYFPLRCVPVSRAFFEFPTG